MVGEREEGARRAAREEEKEELVLLFLVEVAWRRVCTWRGVAWRGVEVVTGVRR